MILFFQKLGSFDHIIFKEEGEQVFGEQTFDKLFILKCA